MLMVLGPHKKKTEARADVRGRAGSTGRGRQADADAERAEWPSRRAQAAADRPRRAARTGRQHGPRHRLN